MAVTTPLLQVTVNGTATTVLEAHTQHSVDASVAQASIVVPHPLPAQVVDNAPVLIEMGYAGDMETVFRGRIRGPVDRALGESERAATIRCDGTLWRAALPRMTDLSFPGPISPRKVIHSLLAFQGVGEVRVEQFVHPVTGKPLMLGGVNWIDEGRVIVPAGTSPLAFIQRMCALWGYRIFDAPDGTVRVVRLSGRPREAEFLLEEGVDLLSVSRGHDLHELVTRWEAQGASGTKPNGREVNIISRPVLGIPSALVPDPPTFIAGSVSDQIMVKRKLANAARNAQEMDYGGVAYRVRCEVPGGKRGRAGKRARQTFGVYAPSLGMAEGMDFWLTGVSRDFTEAGYWMTYEGWRPGGRPVATAPNPPTPPTFDNDDPVSVPPPDTYDPADIPAPSYPDSYPPDIPWGNDDGDVALPDIYDPPPTYPSLPPFPDVPALPEQVDPDYDPAYPSGGLPPPIEGDVDVCEPAPTVEKCVLQEITESWTIGEGDADTPLSVAWIPTFTGDEITISGELLGAGFTLTVHRGGTLLGTSVVTDNLSGWNEWEATLPVAVTAGETLELRFTSLEAAP